MNIVCRFAALLLLLSAVVTAAAETGKIQTLLSLDKPFAAPDFALKGEDGKTYRLSDYRGKVVVLNFWATWCPPCRYEMPSMERAHQKVKGEEKNTVFAFTGQYPVSFPLPLDLDGSVIAKYPVIGLPTTLIIDPRGQVTHRAIAGRAWDDDRLLEQLRQKQQPPEGFPRGYRGFITQTLPP